MSFTALADARLDRLADYPSLTDVTLFEPDARAWAQFKAERPDIHCHTTRSLAPALTTVGRYAIRAAPTVPPTYYLSADMRAEAQADTNAAAADWARLVLRAQPALAEWVDVDFEAESVTVNSQDLDRLTAAAELLLAAGGPTLALGNKSALVTASAAPV